MEKRKAKRKDLLKCKGFNMAPCFNCKRRDTVADFTLVEILKANRQGLNSCEHYI